MILIVIIIIIIISSSSSRSIIFDVINTDVIMILIVIAVCFRESNDCFEKGNAPFLSQRLSKTTTHLSRTLFSVVKHPLPIIA